MRQCSSIIKHGSESEVERLLFIPGAICDFCEWNVCS
jgi:hypothetical protein